VIGRAMIAGGAAFVLLGAPVAMAHPLGNFSINHSHNLSFEPHLIVDRAIVDFAEIPTAQSKDQIDTDGDGHISPAELEVRGQAQCDQLRQAVALNVDSDAVMFTVAQASFSYLDGQAGLPTGRLECRLEARVDLTVPRQVSFEDSFEADRVGWHEVTAAGHGVQLADSPVPEVSGTDELRTYPLDLLGSPLDVRDLTVSVAPGSVTSAGEVEAITPRSQPSIFHGGPLAGAVDRITGTFNDLIGRRDLTMGVGFLAVALAMILGASHALLPGHGKTVMAAYIAGRQGSSRDAVMVGATVTATHTGGVLLLGLALTVSSSLAGESVLGWMGVASGLIITTLGGGLLVGAIGHRAPDHHTHDHRFGHSHHHDPRHHDPRHHEPSHHHHQPFRRDVADQPRSVGRRQVVVSGRVHSQAHGDVRSGAVLTMARPATTTVARPSAVSRRGLVSMGIAGGLVPSPSALIVLLSAIALGRTVFGIVLVIGYGLGMAATLTLAGLLLVRVRDRLQQRDRPGRGRASLLARRWSAVAPYATATLVVAVGMGIAVRGITSIVG
jgi:nickel/cobalt exporter